MNDAPPTQATRRARLAIGLAIVGSIVVLGSLTAALLAPSPPRDVEFVGGTGSNEFVSCQKVAVWTGTVAWTECTWPDGQRAVVELDLYLVLLAVGIVGFEHVAAWL